MTEGKRGLTVFSPPLVSRHDDPYFDGVSADSSPDGSQVVLAADVANGQRALFVVNIDGTRPRRIATPGLNPTSAQWSPDGTWLAFSVGDPESDVTSRGLLRASRRHRTEGDHLVGRRVF